MKPIALLFALIASLLAYSQSESKIDSLESAIEVAPEDTSKVLLYLELHDLLRLSNFNEAARVARTSFNLSRKINWAHGLAKTGRNYGIALNLLGKYDSADIIINEAIDNSHIIGDTSNIGYCYMTLGNIQYDQTNYDEALKFYFKSLEFYKSINNYAGMSSTMIWVGIIYQYAKSNYEAAISSYMEALQYADLGNSALNKSYIFSNLATIYYNQFEYDSALRYYKKSNKISKQFNDQRGIGNDYNNIGNVWYDQKKYDSALTYYERSLKIRREMNDKTGISSALINMGKVYSDLELNEEAKDNYLKGYEIAKSVRYKEGWQQAALLLSTLFEKERSFGKALNYHKEYKAASDSIFNLESDKTLNELQTKYETEKKEQQIALQNAQISEQEAELERRQILLISSGLLVLAILAIALTQRSRLRKKQQIRLQEAEIRAQEAEINATISSQEKERARYARDLHDGFGQMISVLNMNIKSLQDGAKPNERQKVFEASEKVIDEMYGELKNICFDLMPQTLIKHGLESALNEFAGRINQSGKVFVELNVFGLENRLSELQEISLYRISQEWINNILKYSDASKITLQITKDEGEITLLVEDNGTGFDKSSLIQGKGNGWKNLNTRAKLIQGELELETTPEQKGNVLIINAPSVLQKVGEELAAV